MVVFCNALSIHNRKVNPCIPIRILSLVNKLPLEKVESFVALFKAVKAAVFYGRCRNPHEPEQNRLIETFDLYVSIAEMNLKACSFCPNDIRDTVLCNIRGMLEIYSRLFEIADKYHNPARYQKWYGELIAALQ
jgi:hypothetical protein